MANGFIKIHKSILEWEWYRNIKTKTLFLHMILKANWKDEKYEGKLIPRGSFISSVGKLSEETSLTVQEVKTALKHLKSTNEITSKGNNKYTVFTVNNYDLYQCNDNQDNQQVTNKQPISNKQVTNEQSSNNKPLTTIEEYKELKEYKEYKENKKGDTKSSHSQIDSQTDFEKNCVTKLADSYCNTFKASIPESEKQVWALEFRKMKEEHTQEEILKVLDYVIKNPFWRTVIKNPDMLLKHFNTLQAQEAAQHIKNKSSSATNRFTNFEQHNYSSDEYKNMENILLRKAERRLMEG